MIDWSTVGYTAVEAAIIVSFKDAVRVATAIAAERHPVEGQQETAQTASTVRPAKR